MKTWNRQTGRVAENIAVEYLRRKHFAIVERNFGSKFGEIDIIAQDGDTVVFVEVKAKIGSDFGLPEEMITSGKLRRIRNMATMYLHGELTQCRIDVVAIVLGEQHEVLRLTHYENVV